MRINILFACVLFLQISLQSQTPYVSNEARCISSLHKQLDTALLVLCGYENVETLSSDSIVIIYVLMLGSEGKVDSIQIMGSRNLCSYEQYWVLNHVKGQKFTCLLDYCILNTRNQYVARLRYNSYRRRLE